MCTMGRLRSNVLVHLIILVFTATSVLSSSPYQGCWKENVRHRHFQLNIGNYNPDEMTQEYCMARCGLFDIAYAGVTGGKFCFCSHGLPSQAVAPNGNCNSPCAGNSSQPCGGKTHVGVFISVGAFGELEITSSANTVLEAPATVTANASVNKFQSVARYHIDFDDGASFTDPSSTGQFSKTYHLPGKYRLAIEVWNMAFPESSAPKQQKVAMVEIEEGPEDVSIVCEQDFIINIEGQCEVTVWRGSNLKIEADIIGKSIHTAVMPLSDPIIEYTGLWSTAPSGTANNVDTARSILLVSTAIGGYGKMYGIRAHVKRTGLVKFMVLSPTCSSNSYCLTTNACESSCPSMYSIVGKTCIPTDTFCMQDISCNSSCAASSSRFGDGSVITVDSYRAEYVIPHSFAATGENVMMLTSPLDVKPGYILAIEEDGTASGKISVVDTTDDDDIVKAHQTASVGIVFASGGASVFNSRHVAQPLVSYGSKTSLMYTLNGNTGDFPINITVSNNRGFGTPVQNSTDITLIADIDIVVIILGPTYVASGEVAVFNASQHAGTGLRYNWTVDNVLIQSSDNDTLVYTFATPGDYNLSLTIYDNSVSKENSTMVYAQERIEGLLVIVNDTQFGSPTSINVSVAAGTINNCTVDFGDATPDFVYLPSSPAPLEFSVSNTYAIGTFTVTISCYNDIGSNTNSSDVRIISLMSNLRLLTLGALANQDFRLVWEMDSGSQIVFNISLGGNPVAVDNGRSNPAAFRWESELISGLPANEYQYEINATNGVHILSISGVFLVTSPIVNPVLSSDLNDVQTGDPVTFTINMDSGSDVSIEVDYQDGLPNETFTASPPGSPWTAPWVFTHGFAIGCNCSVTAYFSNNASSFVRQIVIRVEVGATNLNWDLPHDKYYLYNPPAYINFRVTLTGVLPPDLIYVLTWGDGSPEERSDTLAVSPDYYFWQFDDTEDYYVDFELTSSVITKAFIHKAIVIEKLVGPAISLEFPSAPLNKPFGITFSLFRGDQGNYTILTWNCDDGNAPYVTERQGIGEDGADTLPVTYNSLGSKTVTVTATAPLGQLVSSSETFNVIHGVDQASLVVTTNGDTSFGSPTNFIILYTSAPMPDTAAITIDRYGDGTDVSAPQPFTIGSAGGTQTISYTYPKDGLHNAKVSITNDASKVVISVQTGVYKPFTNLRSDASFIPDSLAPNPTPLLGLNGLQQHYPLDKPVYFKLSDDNNAFASTYDITSLIHPTGGDITGTFNHNNFNVNFTEEGMYRLQIVARNPLFSQSITQNIEMVTRVKNLIVTEESTDVSPGNSKLFNVSFGEYGADTCVYIDWDDLGAKVKYGNNLGLCTDPAYTSADMGGDMVALTGNYIGHRYLREGVYTLTVKAINAYGSETMTVEFPISYGTCSQPQLAIHDQKTVVHYATEHKRSEITRIFGYAIINCPESYKNDKKWKLEKVDGNTGVPIPIPPVDVSGLELSKAELYIPARYLDIAVYKATYIMNMKLDSTQVDFLTETSTYFKIVESDLIGMMVQGGVLTEKTLGISQTITLTPLAWSLDPDMDPSVMPQGLSVASWECEVLDVTDQSSCAQINTNAVATQNVQGALWLAGTRYKITVNMVKGTRQAMAQMIIWVNGTISPDVVINCVHGSVCYQLSNGYQGLATSRSAIECSCNDCTSAAVYKWEIFIKDYRWPNRWRPIREAHLVNKSITTDDETCGYSDQSCATGVFSKYLALQSRLYDKYKHVADVYRVQCVVRDGSLFTKVATNIIMNQPPEGGNCTITPLVATATVDNKKQWEVYCWDWQDGDGIKDYQVTSFIHEDEIEKEITSYPTSSGGFLTKVALPVGPTFRNYQQDVYIYIRDTKNAVRRMKIATVTVNPPAETEIRNYVAKVLQNDYDPFFKPLHEGDQRSVSELVTAVSVILAYSSTENEEEFHESCLVESTWLNTGYGPSSGPRDNMYTKAPDDVTIEQQYAYDSLKSSKAKLRSKMVSFLLDMSIDDRISIQQVSGALAEVTSKPTEIDHDTQRAILDGVDEMITNLADPVKMKNIPQEDIQKAMDNLYSTIGAMADAAGSYGYFPLPKDAETARNDSSWLKYETSNIAFEDETDLSRTRSYEEAMVLHTLRIHKKNAAEKIAETADRVYALLDKMVNLFQTFAIPGQRQEGTGYRTKYRLDMNFAHNFLGQTIGIHDSTASVTFPKTMNGLFSSGNVGTNDVVTLQVVQTTNAPQRYTDNAMKYLPVDSQTHYVSIDFYNSSTNRLNLSQIYEPIRIVIPNDPNAPKPENKMVQPFVADWNRFMLHTTETPTADFGIHLNFEIENDTQLVVVAKHGGVPDPSTNDTDFIFIIPSTVSEESNIQAHHSIIINKTMVDGRIGKWTFGIIERNGSHVNTPVPTNSELVERYEKGSGEFSRYNLTLFLSGCFYYRAGAEDWDTEGCVVAEETTAMSTVCLCSHLTTFAGGLIVAPNTIDWDYVFSNIDFLSNPTLYVTEIVVFLGFVIGFIMARRKDKADVSKRGLAPLPDNNENDKYMYEIVVSTGMRQNSGTESNIFFIMSGENDETEIRVLSDTKRETFKRGMTNGFLMAVPKCLGRLNYVRVWHDNSGDGKFGSWFLNYIALKDLQKDTKQVFILNRWLAVEEEDGQIDRIIPLAGKEQLSDFSYQFGERSKKNLLDDHLWFSLVARPPGSRFSCVERVACCLCLLFMTMMSNAMFYNTQDNENSSASTSFDLGPFSLSVSQITIGFVSTIIVFPANFLIVFMFRRSKSRHITASKNQEGRSDNIVSPNDVRLRPASSLSTTSIETRASESSTATILREKKTTGGVEKKKSCQLPWWCVIIAWIMLILLTLLSTAMVTFYGITFGDKTCRQWISSLFVSFLTSIFITQPIKVILLALFLSLIVKNPEEEDDDDEVEDEIYQDNHSGFLHTESFMTDGVIKYMPKEPPSEKELKKLREERLKEVKMWGVIREIFFYFLFIWILMVIAHRNRSSDNFHYKNSMYRTFISSLDTDIPFNEIKTGEDFWRWAKSGLTGGLLAGSYYNNYPPLRLRTYINDKASRILGHAVLRQNRIKPGRCELSDYFKDIIDECNTNYEFGEEQKEEFDIGWLPLGTTSNGSTPEYKYSSAESLDGYPYWGYRAVYSGGGYVAHLNGSKQTILDLMTRLEREGWIDRLTRSVFVEFTVYNPQVNLFSMNLLLAEFDTTNSIVTSHRFEPAMLLPYTSGTMIFQLICEIVFLIYLLIFTIGELKNLYQQKLRYFTHFWNWLELWIIGLSTGAVVIYFYRLYETNRLTAEFKKSKGLDYIKFQYVSYWNEIIAYLLGFIVFLGTLKFLKLLRFNQRVSMLSNTMKCSSRSLLHFSVIALIVFLAFVQMFFLAYMTVDESYSSFIESVVASILMMMGKFNIYTMIMAEPILTQMFVLCFVVTMTFIIVNMFISILNDAFSEVRGNLKNQSNEYEIIEFILERFRNWLGYGVNNGPKQTSGPPNGRDDFTENDRDDDNFEDNADSLFGSEMQMFPDRIKRLLHSLSVATILNNPPGFNKMNTVKSAEWMRKKPYSAPKSALEDFFPGPSSPRRFLMKEKRRTSLARVDTG